MSNRQLIIVAVVAAVMVVVTVILHTSETAPQGELVRGAFFIQGLDLKEVHKVVVEHGKDTVTLEQARAGMRVVEKDNYPASAKSFKELVRRCLTIRCAEKITEDPDNHEKLGVLQKTGEDKDDEEKAEEDEGPEPYVVAFYDKDGKLLTGFLRGKTTDNGGVYVRQLGRDAVYRTEETVWFDTSPMDYIDKELVGVERDHVKRVEVRIRAPAAKPEGDQDKKDKKGKKGKKPGDLEDKEEIKTYVISRDDKKDVKLQDIPKGMRAKGADCEDVFYALSSLDMSNVLTAAKAEELKLRWDGTYACDLYTGISYAAQLAENDGKHYVRLKARLIGVDPVWINEEKDKKKQLDRADAATLAQKEAPRFSWRHRGWVYEISSWDAGKMRKTRADLIEEDLPDEVTVGHILVAYKGAEKADDKITRSKDEAKKRAEEALAKVKKKPDDFKKLAKDYSDDAKTKEKGGELGEVKKDSTDHDAAFIDAARRLKVGKVSDVVETPRGFHIIRRTK